MSADKHILKNIFIYISELKFKSLMEYILSIFKKYFLEDTDMFQKLYQLPFCLGILLLTSLGNNAFAETATSSESPTVGMLNMPPVTPQEAAEYLNKRVVPSSSLPRHTKAEKYSSAQEYTEKEGRVRLNVDTVLGHEPPAGTITKYGFKRADLAPESSSVIKRSENTDGSGTATTVIIKKNQTSPAQITTIELPEIRANKEILTK
ncbi:MULTISPECIES: hypothetical protein [Xenorhabdus]|uniref:hypothetical protein n=1 Tax=Xenorhabdus TaxID=626 RepID=UPI001E4995CB|nr:MULTISPECIES: hypothetical protein [Xenorhabdus]